MLFLCITQLILARWLQYFKTQLKHSTLGYSDHLTLVYRDDEILKIFFKHKLLETKMSRYQN